MTKEEMEHRVKSLVWDVNYVGFTGGGGADDKLPEKCVVCGKAMTIEDIDAWGGGHSVILEYDDHCKSCLEKVMQSYWEKQEQEEKAQDLLAELHKGIAFLKGELEKGEQNLAKIMEEKELS